MPEAPKGTKPNGVYQIDQKTGQLKYKGQYPGKGQDALQNSIRTSGARAERRTKNAFRGGGGKKNQPDLRGF